jgi:glycosyltransferase involved in cell wall biosynthesis
LKHELEVLGINYNGLEKNPYNYHIYPANTGLDIYGFDRLNNVIESTKPEIVVLFNDIEIIQKYLNRISFDGKVVPVFPLNYDSPNKDILLDFSRFGITHAGVYNENARSICASINPCIDYNTIYHGVNYETIGRISEARDILKLDENVFVVGCVATNTHRKRLDLLLEAYSKFCKDKNSVLIIHTSKSGCYDLKAIAKYFGISNKVVLSYNKLTNEELSVLYSTFDLNVNTSMGEGFGLPLLEGAVCGCPVVCPQDGNLKSIWGDSAIYIDTARTTFVPDVCGIGHEISTDSLSYIFEYYYSNRNALKSKSEEVSSISHLRHFSWLEVASKVDNLLTKVSNSSVSLLL